MRVVFVEEVPEVTVRFGPGNLFCTLGTGEGLARQEQVDAFACGCERALFP